MFEIYVGIILRLNPYHNNVEVLNLSNGKLHIAFRGIYYYILAISFIQNDLNTLVMFVEARRKCYRIFLVKGFN